MNPWGVARAFFQAQRAQRYEDQWTPEQRASYQAAVLPEVTMSAATEEVQKAVKENLDAIFASLGQHCRYGPHRRPQGPCEDIAVCQLCWSLSYAMRPPGECYGHHAPDCSLPERHQSYCKPGGTGHPTGHLRGYPEFTWESRE